ncbi:ty3-gypsy retrotransposon protein [Cucumis melo var. makuwa]|uniref:Ty3-gypsy retrotransposon protein n=1 Tax=Cucumis melo var. makuwa TaxID=1194695 RepID=A0A5A7TMZ6_CUCMM|nr:ty3-gypsy retrotransposon protein [Cucumis melo var. makuwa]
MHDVDVILCMDWLVANHASTDCSRKDVVCNPPAETDFKYKWVGTMVLHKVISVMKSYRGMSGIRISNPGTEAL